jgi:hypothetical protein
LLNAGKIELAIEVLKLKELRAMSGSIDKIAVEGIEVDGVIKAIYDLQP